MKLQPIPPQPPESRWKFVDALRAPMWTRHPWTPRPATENEADLSRGVRITCRLPDPAGRLQTAWEDLERFLAAGGIGTAGRAPGAYEIVAAPMPSLASEAFRCEVRKEGCRILAADIEGVRRAVFFLEDRMLAARGPFLPLGATARRPGIKRRISRCFFGPIKRPPKMRDELLDDEDYYPDEYLNRLAHEGVNGLWLTVAFRELCRTRFTPDAAPDAPRRLDKLRRTVAQCLRYGIRTYLFTIEPSAWSPENPLPATAPELAGHPLGPHHHCFCPSAPQAAEYLYESLYRIFQAAPELGGLINISHGERATTCLSALAATGEGAIRCPRCAEKKPWEILAAALDPMVRGMHAANPEAEFISWLYMPQARGAHGADVAPWVYEIPAHTPEGVILQFNFESGVRREFFGRERIGGDYWISAPGPSERFERIARIAREAGTPISAKIQTGTSHETASVPFVPVPGHLHEKFAAMHRLGVEYTMLCWYFGNYPGLMNRAAGALAFVPFPGDRETFLLDLARRDWGEHAPQVVEAWRRFSHAYSHYPLTNLFQYYGPMHDGPVWPLLLEPADAPLAPTWLLASPTTREPYPPSGDRIGECFMFAFSLDEILELCRRMAEEWARGVEILAGIAPNFRDQPERLLDIGLARALGIQFQSGHNILRFYAVREKMLRMDGPERLELLRRLAAIIEEELALDNQLLELCRNDSRLGFHSEAEGYKYYPEKIRWRMRELQRVLREEVPRFEQTIRRGELLFPEYTGRRPAGLRARCAPCPADSAGAASETPAAAPDRQALGPFHWRLCRDAANLRFRITGQGRPPVEVSIRIEPRRLWPCLHFVYTPGGARGYPEEIPDRVAPRRVEGVLATPAPGRWELTVAVPFAWLHISPEHPGPIRANLRVHTPDRDPATWAPEHPRPPRLRLGSDNPADLGWLLFD